MTSDGSSIAGYNQAGGGVPTEAFLWTSSNGLQGLGHLEAEFFLRSEALGISADGSVVVGNSGSNPSAFRWTSASGMQGLGALAGDFFSTAYGVSANGSTIVGSSFDGTSGGVEAFIWTEGSGMTGLGSLPDATFSEARAVSGDGNVVVGTSGTLFGSRQAFRWENGIMVGLGNFPGGANYSEGLAVSADGSTVVGRADDANSFKQPFRWTAETGMVSLGSLNNCHSGEAFGVSGDGQSVVGRTVCDQAFIWTATDGIQSLYDVLVANGATGLDGWFLYEARAISPDGQWVAGYAVNSSSSRQAFIANISPIPVPAAVWLFGSALGAMGWLRRQAA